jgi:hypothetical protein
MGVVGFTEQPYTPQKRTLIPFEYEGCVDPRAHVDVFWRRGNFLVVCFENAGLSSP